jgi:DNA polymerase III sliding clamp (beta) subunit (PCNA family)
MIRTELLALLKRVSPALSSKDFVAVFSCLCFDGKTVTAYDDQVALSALCEWPVEGGLRGDVLMGWLGASRGQDVEASTEDTFISLKCGRSKLKVAAIAKKDFVFKFPEDSGESLKFPTALLEAMGRCVGAMGRDPSRPWQAGLTVAWVGDKARLYATNGICASVDEVEVPAPKNEKLKTLLLPPKLTELVVSIGRSDHPKTLILGKGWIEVQFASGLRLFGRTSKDADPSKFEELVTEDLRAKAKTVIQDVPKGLGDALDRALVVLGSVREKVTKLTVKDGKLILTTGSGPAALRDSLKMPGHPDASETLPAEHLRSGLAHATRFGIIDGVCAVLKGTKFFHLVAVVKEAE